MSSVNIGNRTILVARRDESARIANPKNDILLPLCTAAVSQIANLQQFSDLQNGSSVFVSRETPHCPERWHGIASLYIAEYVMRFADGSPPFAVKICSIIKKSQSRSPGIAFLI